MVATEVEQLAGGGGEREWQACISQHYEMVCVYVCVYVHALLITWLYICNVLHVPCCRVEQSADFRLRVELYHLVSGYAPYYQ